jgi:hypothetical protein
MIINCAKTAVGDRYVLERMLKRAITSAASRAATLFSLITLQPATVSFPALN